MIESFYFISAKEIEILLSVVLAIALGSLVGAERELHKRPAGLRTHILVCVGATLFTIASINFIGTGDTSRIAAGIVTGIGFLGAGIMFRSENHLEGVTTAADLWVLSAIGILIGIQYYVVAALSTIIILLVLYLGKKAKLMIKDEKETVAKK